MDTRDLAMAGVPFSLELAQALGKRSTGAAGASPPRARNSTHISSSIDGDVGKGEEHVALAAGGLKRQFK